MDIDAAVDEILANQKVRRSAPVAERPIVQSEPRANQGLKRRIRSVVRAAIVKYDGIAYVDEVNTITNRVYKRLVRPALAQAWREGAEAGGEAVAACCGCVAPIPDNPYES